MQSEEEAKLHPIFEKLQKKFQSMKLKEEADKAKLENLTMSQRFEIQTRNFEVSLFNLTLYNVHESVKEKPLSAQYIMSNETEEFIYSEYFKATYPYSSVTIDRSGNQSVLKIVLLDEDREKFLYSRGFKIEERMIPETYFVPLK